MQIGDKVRFLNEIGGGRITGFQGRDIVFVEDEDGFDIPMLRSQVVVIDTNANNFVKKDKGLGMKDERSGMRDEGVFTPKERKGGDLLNVCLAFVPEDVRELTNTRFEAYLINDSNYFVSAIFANNEGAAWHTRWQGTLEPNTKQYIESFDRSVLNDLERLSVQLIMWKQDKPFMLKPAVSVELRLDTVKFYKLHVFQPSPFFREAALVYDIVRDDRPIRQVFVEAEEVLDAMRGEEIPAKSALSDVPTLPEAPETLESPIAPSAPSALDPPFPQRTREEERAALKAAKRALKEQERAKREKERAEQAERERIEREERELAEKEGRPLVVDLHIEALLDNITGLSPSVLLHTQLTEFRIIMDRHFRQKGKRIVFIHGKGDGVLREALIHELRHRYRSCTFEDADFQRYGHGATMVTIR